MANKIDTAIDAVLAAFTARMVDGVRVFKNCKTELVNPMESEVLCPYVAMVLGGVPHVGGPAAARQWNAELLIEVVAVSKSSQADATISELIANAEYVLDHLGSIGAVVEMPKWAVQHNLTPSRTFVWATGTADVRIMGPLLT